jgi:hypothetical protein
MENASLSSWWKENWPHVVAFIWAAGGTTGLICVVVFNWEYAPGIAKEYTEQDFVGIVAAMGAIGGFIRWIHSFAKSLGQPGNPVPQLVNGFLVPLKGAALALILVLLFRAGVAGPNSPPQGANTAQVNWIGLYGIAGVAGLFANEAIEKLEQVFSSLFGTK